MQRALQLAALGMGSVAPNPMVGCVIVHNNTIIGEGYHQQYGGPHAEVNAVNSVKNKELIKESTIYVSLEPCAHYGKTPPCAELLVKHLPKKVMVCNLDPNPLVAGKGIALLREAGIQVETGILAEEGQHLNRRFFVALQQNRPYIILKWAQTANGYVAHTNKTPLSITGPLANTLNHQMRSQEQAIFIGMGTALADNPSLTTRHWSGKNPIRIVLDPMLDLPMSAHFFDDNSQKIVVNTQKNQDLNSLKFLQINPKLALEDILSVLHAQGIQSVIVEGGTKTLQRFITTNLWDEARVFTSNKEISEGYQGPIFNKKYSFKQTLETDTLAVYYNL
jgi:diaminohydroxyphosphoribosylaminopyrimidine deaminase / 5-amino-6-(5-phosphoribosylamino)uracil reductase